VFDVEVRHRAGQVALHVNGTLDLATAPAFRQAAVRALADLDIGDGPPRVVVDLTACDHLDSVGVGLVLGVFKRVRARDGALTVVCPEPRVRLVLELTGVDRLLPVVDRLTDAMPTAAAAPTEIERVD
jgi:anti-sigma B factor antagonist